MTVDEVVSIRGKPGKDLGGPKADPVTTEVIRQGLNAGADQMKVALRRAAFSPVIYEMIDFACGIYDTDVRMLAQARSLPSFLGTLGFCIEAAVKASGGEAQLEPGDVLWSTDGYANGSHPQDAVVVVPVFLDDTLVGYSVIKAHHLDIGAKEMYCTDTTDNFQEGVIFPGVKLYRSGVLQRDLYRTILANSRLPQALSGDLNAQLAAARMGASSLLTLIEKYGVEQYERSLERMFDAGEAIVRRYLEDVPDGRYIAKCALDSDGLTDDMVEFDVAVEIEGSDVVVDFSDSASEQAGPINCPLPTTVSTARMAILALLGGNEMPNEGHFRPIEVRARPGTLFFPRPPAPIFLYGWPSDQAVEGILQAISAVTPARARAASGGDLCGISLWGNRDDGSLWACAMDQPVGHGAKDGADGGSPLIIISCSGIRNSPAEVVEARYPVIVERCELAPDSGGAGRFRGGLGTDVEYRLLRDSYMTAIVERTKTPPEGLFGGGSGRPNRLEVRLPDGSVVSYSKVTRLALPAESVVAIQTGGGGGYGPAAERDREAVFDDVGEGYVSESEARRLYPQAF